MHLWLALSPHGYGHAVMTAPLVAALKRRLPGLELTIQTSLPSEFLESRYGAGFRHVAEIHDFGFRMISSVGIDLEASRDDYRRLHDRWPEVIESEATRLGQARPDLVLSNVSYVTLAGASRAGIPAVGVSSVNWLDMYAHYLGHVAEAPAVLADMRQAYESARLFLRPCPAMTMSLANRRDIGPLAMIGQARGGALRQTFSLDPSIRIGLIAFGGIGHPLDLTRWPAIPGWFWLTSSPAPDRADMADSQRCGLPFIDLIPSVDAVITKPGYGTFTEAGLAGTPLLYLPRPDWPECPHLENWLSEHGRCHPIVEEGLFDGRLSMQLHSLLSLARPEPATASGIDQGVVALLETLHDCKRS